MAGLRRLHCTRCRGPVLQTKWLLQDLIGLMAQHAQPWQASDAALATSLPWQARGPCIAPACSPAFPHWYKSLMIRAPAPAFQAFPHVLRSVAGVEGSGTNIFFRARETSSKLRGAEGQRSAGSTLYPLIRKEARQQEGLPSLSQSTALPPSCQSSKP